MVVVSIYQAYALLFAVTLVEILPLVLSNDDSVRGRRRVYFGSIDNLRSSPSVSPAVWNQSSRELVLNTARRKAVSSSDEEVEDPSAEDDSRVRMWPPWPFNLIGKPWRSRQDAVERGYSKNSVSLFWPYFGQQMRITKRQLQHVTSQLWFHLPPAGAPLVLLACLPQKRHVASGGETLVKSAPILFANPFARNLVLASLGVSILSWSSSELNRRRRLVPLPLPEQYRDVSRAILPPFLPEEVPDVDVELLRSMEKEVQDEEALIEKEDREISNSLPEGLSGLSPRVRRHLQNIYHSAERKPRTFRTTLRQWGRMRELRRVEQAKVRRARIVDELIALTALKKKAKKRKAANDRFTEEKDPGEPLGYAMVTGASRGIGRAIAVELARWEIPLILVARDVKRLTDLACEIEACYGVKCCVLPADLSEPGVAERIHSTTKDAGLKVDILVNNAGVCSSGLSVDLPSSDIEKMMHVNALSVAMLHHLYGRDMKEQGRGRILMVSSIVGAVEAGPTVACYAATKAFERSLAMSTGKELEQFGVGVTCLMPGAVKDTSFQSRSEVDDALCWKLPFYPRTAPIVAKQGVFSMLAGDVQVIPGWQNRVFLKVLEPILPQRLTTAVVQMAWSPLGLSPPKFEFPTFSSKHRNRDNGSINNNLPPERLADMPTLWPGTKSNATPRMLKLPDKAKSSSEEKEEVVTDEAQALDTDKTTVSSGVSASPSMALIEYREYDEDQSRDLGLPPSSPEASDSVAKDSQRNLVDTTTGKDYTETLK